MQTKKRAKPIQFGRQEVVSTKESADETKEVIEKGDTEIIVSVKEEEVEARIHTRGATEHREDEVQEEVGEEAAEKKDAAVLTKEQLALQNEEYLRLTEEKENADQDSSMGGNDKSESAAAMESDEEESAIDSESEQVEKPRLIPHDPNSFAFTEGEDIPTEKKHSFLFFFFIAFVAFLVGLGGIAGGYSLVKDHHFTLPSLSSIPFLSEATPTNEPTPITSPTPKEVDLSAYTIRILNGSGITGQAATLKTALTDAGYTVGETGNADSSDYTQTVISAQTNVEQAYLQKLEELLKKTYQVDSTVKTIPSVGDSQVTVTIGSETAAK
jgi:hypothetical protein